MRWVLPIMAACAGALGVPATAMLAGFGHGCTLAGCSDSRLQIHLPAEMAAGTWAFELRLGTTWSCETTLPAEPGYVHDCAGDEVLLGIHDPATSPASAGAFVVRTMPESVEIVARHEGTELIRRASAPAYSNHYPNGPECEPACPRAELQLDLREET